ncbi:efflux RND transporter permease subunit, partial [Acinetobacter gyllenbergii]
LAQGFVALKPWDVRTAKENSADAIQKRAMKYFSRLNNAQINVTLPPSVNGLGQTDGLDFWIQDLNGQGQNFLDGMFRQLQTQSKNYSTFENFDKQSTNSKANLNIKIDQKQALANSLE